MFRMRPRPLVRAAGVAATTAVVAATAGAVRHHQEQRYAQQAPEAPAPAPEPAAAAPDLTSQLQQLAQLHNAGVLNDEEFAAAKQKLLAG